MLANELRSEFLRFCGTSLFRKFATSLVKLSDEPLRFDRLRYWQEVLWSKFLTHCHLAPLDVNEIGSILHWCDLHDGNLVLGTGYQPVDLRYSDLFEQARTDTFPHGCGWLRYHCPACRTCCEQWVVGHPAECRMLQHRVFDADWLTRFKDDHTFRSTLRNAYIPLDEILPGDEIWSFDSGRGSNGIALVRNGRIVPIMD
jgi:hypothetical protein